MPWRSRGGASVKPKRETKAECLPKQRLPENRQMLSGSLFAGIIGYCRKSWLIPLFMPHALG